MAKKRKVKKPAKPKKGEATTEEGNPDVPPPTPPGGGKP